jgi:hypothetical protein
MHSGRCAVGYPFELIGREQVVPKAVRLVPIFTPTAAPMRSQFQAASIAAAPAAVAAAPARIRTVAILATVRCPTATVARQHATGAHRMRRPLRPRHLLGSQKFLGHLCGLWRAVLGVMATSTAVHAVDRNDGLDLPCHLLLFPRSVTSAFCRRFKLNLSPILKSEASEGPALAPPKTVEF